MDRNAPSSKRRQPGAQATTKPPVRVARGKRVPPEPARQAATGKIRAAKSSHETARAPARTQAGERPSAEDDPNKRNFTVANVGRNGTLYLKPSRIAPAHFAHALATPPTTADGPEDNAKTEWPLQRRSSISGTYTPRPLPQRSAAGNSAVPMPPLSMANVHQRRRTRSHSFSTVDGSARSATFDSNDFQILLNGREASQRPKSSVDLTDGLLNLSIPHYKLGTPRFSERGTAYLHNSTYTSMTDDMRSSVFSRGEWDKLFPTPRAGPHGSSYFPRQSSSPYLHPSRALTSSRTPPTPSSLNSDGISAAIYDKVEANINDPTLVRYSPATGRITAATPARLVSQITSPLFLDYELLADFFLTYRNFLSSRDLMEYLLARMQWALDSDSDAGRIVRVRTFVAIRHWILNYFADDFLMDLVLRQRFCILVNNLAHSLWQRPGHGGTDLNVIGELKKCWRRTCAMFWAVPDAMDSSPAADILPGQPQEPSTYGNSATSLPLSVRRHGSQLDFRRSSLIRLPAEPARAEHEGLFKASVPESTTSHVRTASIPTSPMSEQSMTVLSCSVPFLRHLKPLKEKSTSPRPPGPQRHPPHDKAARPVDGHKRSGSFSDALRDKRAPLPSQQPDSVDFRALPSFAMTGGLVRGLLLQPSPSKVDMLVPLSPELEHRETGAGAGDSRSAYERNPNPPMKKIVGDVRRAISRKGRHESPSSSHRSTNSSDSRNSGHVGERHDQYPAWQQLRGPIRVDKLGQKIENSYSEVFDAVPVAPGQQLSEWSNERPGSDLNRLNSHVTTGSRSIVIMDATGVPDMPPGALPSVSSWASGVAQKPKYRNPDEAFEDIEMREWRPASGSPTAVASDVAQPGPDPPLHDLLAVPDTTRNESAVDSVQARKSSNVHPGTFEMPPIRHQLRKRPGGDLKAADYVHEMEPAPRPYTDDSYSTFSQAITSGEPSQDLSGTHFSGQFGNGLRLRDKLSRGQQRDSVALLNTHSSQPNMRPSFEKQVAHLASVAGTKHDGGIEDALARLEGKTSSFSASDSTAADTLAQLQTSKPGKPPKTTSVRAIKNLSLRNIDSQTVDTPAFSPHTDRQGASIYRLSASDDDDDDDDDDEPDQSVAAALSEQMSTSSPASTRLYKFRPRKPASPTFTKRSAKTKTPSTGDENVEEDGTKTEKWEEPKSATPKGSFLLDDNESLSDISTEIADQSGDESLGVRSFFFDDTVDDDGGRASMPFRGPPTPPSTEGPTASHSRERSPVLSPTMAEAKRPLKEAASAPRLMASKPSAAEQFRPSELRRVQTSPSGQKTAHLPFVLAFDSDVIAEQMTIIEKDALDEVDWKDLIALNWQQTPCQVRNWVEFLKSESNGIDIVISRFNLVVKWVVSECVLTEAPGERARCITKYISIATHCHRLRNYASMYQITLALLSSDISRLRQTWSLVPPASKTMLDRLERLCQPVRNFYHLRSEMEAASADEGCVPFIGLYTHDLMFNAQKPGLIDPTPPGKEKLVNFERYQTAANIVKGLLRLIESSSKYVFRPHPEILSRSLWLAALDDSEVSARSKALES